MNFKVFYENREKFICKLCLRNYDIKYGKKLIALNIKTNIMIFLEDMSADLFEIIVKSDFESAVKYIKDNDLLEEEVAEFISDLFASGIFNTDFENVIETNLNDRIEVSEQRQELEEFMNELYENGFLFSVHIDTTFKCNLRCKHCYHPFDDYFGKEDMSITTIKKLVDDVYDLGVFSVTLSGGESLLRSDFWDIVEYISNKGLAISIFTNATLIDKGVIDNINRFNVEKVGVSLYSVSNQVHEEITQVNGSAIKTQKALQLLKDADCMVEVKCSLMESNYSTYQELDRYCKNNGFSLVLDNNITPMLNGDGKTVTLGMNYEQLVEYSMDSDFNFYVGNNKPLNWNRNPCDAGKSSLYCSPDGTIYPCVSLRLELGNAKDIKNIWSSSEILAEWREKTISDFKHCGKFSYCNFCFEICAGINLMENGDYCNGNTSNCLKAKARQDAYNRLKENSLL